MKYIDAEELLAEIDRQEVGYNTDGKHAAEYDTCKKIIDIINSLKQKQPEMDLEEEISRWLESGDITDTRFDDYDDSDIERTARHFYKLGLKGRKEE